MPYETRYRTAYRIVEQDLGYDLIPTCRPRFIFFSFVGVRPNTPHWIFFDGIDVTKWVNTSYTLEDFNDEDRNSDLRNPGDKYLNAVSFPASLGGPTAASGPINSDSTGTIEGVFYLQSNSSLSFNTGRRVLTAIDISVLNKPNSLSYSEAEYAAIGQYQLYYEFQQEYQEEYDFWVDPPTPVPPLSNNNYNDDDDDDRSPVTHTGSNVDLPGNVITRALGIEYDADGDGDTTDGDDGCVIATYAQHHNSSILTLREKKKAELWCIRAYHNKWWGEAIRRGYRYLGRKAIANNKAEQHFQEFIDYVSFGRGEKRNLKTLTTFVFRTAQFFVYGLTVARKEK